MLQKVIPVPAAQRFFDPARASARLLGWFGMSLLMVAAPLAGVLSRRALFIILPIGAGLLAAAFLIAVSGIGLRAFRDALRQPVGLAAGFLFVWAGLSLAWTPFPGEVAPGYVASLATAVFAALIIAHMPERRAMPALNLLPAGLTVTALATLGMALFGPATFRGGSEFDPSLLERSVLTLVVLVWPALGALATFARWRLAMALALLVVATISLAHAQLGMAIFAIGAVTFAFAVADPPRTASRAAIVFAALILAAPLIPFVLAPIATAIPGVGRSTIAAMTDWRDLVVGDGPRLITGHGLGTAAQGVAGGWLPPHTPRTTLFEIWYELGLLGATSLTGTFALGFLVAGRAASHAAPPLLAGMVVTFSIAVFGLGTAQLWFVALASLQAVAFGLLCRSSRSGPRVPAARVEPFGDPLRAPPGPASGSLSRPTTPAPATLPHM